MIDFKKSRRDPLPWVPVILAFPAVGWLVGWLTGASNSPVVGAILPLLFGLVGATAYGMLERHAKLDAARKRIAELDLKDSAIKIALEAVSTNYRGRWFPAFWGVAVLLFCVACFAGIHVAAQSRVRSDLQISELLANSGIEEVGLNAAEYAMVYNLALRLRELQLSKQEIEHVLSRVTAPEPESNPNDTCGYAYHLGEKGKVLACPSLSGVEVLLGALDGLRPQATGTFGVNNPQ